jgi:hypothetical protein
MEQVRALPHARVDMLALPMRSLLSSAHGLALCSILVVGSTGCADGVSNDSKCRNLAYKEGGLSRAEYLPCAGEIVAALEVVDQNTSKALDGDGQARSEGQAALGRARGLMRAAGGRNLLERWQDQALTDMKCSTSHIHTPPRRVRLPRPSTAVRHEGMRKLVARIARCSSRSALLITKSGFF